MKINVEVDMTPEEFRRAMGLPDIQPLQDELIRKAMEMIEAGAEGYDPLLLLQPYFAQGFDSMANYQKVFTDILTSYTSTHKTSSK